MAHALFCTIAFYERQKPEVCCWLQIRAVSLDADLGLEMLSLFKAQGGGHCRATWKKHICVIQLSTLFAFNVSWTSICTKENSRNTNETLDVHWCHLLIVMSEMKKGFFSSEQFPSHWPFELNHMRQSSMYSKILETDNLSVNWLVDSRAAMTSEN